MRKTCDNVEIFFSLKLIALSLYIMLFIVFSQAQEDNIIISMLNLIKIKKGKGAHEPKAHTARAYTSFHSMKNAKEYCYSPLDRMLVHCRVTPQQ